MAGFSGKWQLKDVKNGQAFYDAIKSPEEHKEKLKKLGEAVKADPNAYYEQLTVDKASGTIQRVVFINGEKKKDSGVVKVGTEIDHQSADGRPVKAKITIDSDTKITRVENGDGFSTVTVIELSGDTMTATMTGSGVTCTMTYQRA
jgi:hypothetical protein